MLRKLEGFEGMREVTHLGRIYTLTGSVSTVTGHRGIGSGASSTSLTLLTPDLLDGAADENVWTVGIAVAVPNNPFAVGQTVHPYIAMRSAAGEQIRFELIPSLASKPGGNYFKIRAMRGATELATSVERFPVNNSNQNWTYLEFQADIQTGTSGSFDVHYSNRRVRDQVVTWDASNTGINTANQGAAGADRVEISLVNDSSPVATVAIDNIYMLDGSGAVNNDFLGEVEIESLTVSGNGDTTQWDLNGGAASLEDAVNEPTTTSNVTEDDKRITTKDVGAISLGALTNIAQNTDVTIVGVEARMAARMEASGTRDVQFFYRKTTGSPAQTGGKIVTLSSTSIVGHSDVQETDPNTAAAWVRADVDGLQLGVELDA